MLVLNATNQSIEVLMSGAAATTNPSYMASYADNTASAFTEGEKDGALNGATAVTVVAAPAASTRRVVAEIIIYNEDTAAVTITVRLNNNGTYRNLYTTTIDSKGTWTLSGSGSSGSASAISDVAYAGSWDSVVDQAPSKNAVYDKVQTLMNLTGSNLAIGSDADGDMYYRASGVLARLAKGAANTKLFMNAGGTAPEWGVGVKIGTFTRDGAAASGDVSYTGVGFKPAAILCLMAVNTTSGSSLGFSDGTNHYCWMSYLDTYTKLTSSSVDVIYLYLAAGTQRGTIKSFDSDGFTITWSKDSSPTGTMNVFYIAFR